MKTDPTQTFLENVRQRLVMRRYLRAATYVTTGAAAGFLIYAVAWRLTGHAVPWGGFAVAVILAAIAWVGWVSLRDTGVREAAEAADEQFGLKDGLASVVGFEGKDGEVFDLQKQSVEKRLEGESSDTVPLHVPWKFAAGGTAMLVVGMFIATLPPSEAVQEKLDAEAAMLGKSEEVKEELEEIVEEILADLDEEEKDALDQDEVRAWLEELKETPDAKEALRQLARFEQKLAKSMAGLESREDEEAMKMAAAELSRSDQSASRQVGKKLETKEFSEAAEKLQEMSPVAKKPMTAKERAEMARKLREATKRLARGANSRGQKSEMAQLSQALDDSLKNLVDLGEFDEDSMEAKDCMQ